MNDFDVLRSMFERRNIPYRKMGNALMVLGANDGHWNGDNDCVWHASFDSEGYLAQVGANHLISRDLTDE